MNIIENVNRLEDYLINESEISLIDIQKISTYLTNIREEAINYTRCSTQLKDGEVPSFAYWLKHHKYETTKDSNILTKNNNNFVRGELFKKYRTEYNF